MGACSSTPTMALAVAAAASARMSSWADPKLLCLWTLFNLTPTASPTLLVLLCPRKLLIFVSGTFELFAWLLNESLFR